MSPIRKTKRDLCRSTDLSTQDIETIFELAGRYKSALLRREQLHPLQGRSLAMIFEKPSLRTRSTFEIGMVQLGGHAIYLTPAEIGLGKRESVSDIAKNLERWFDLGMARTFKQSTVDELAGCCRIPFINALSDEEHPCQALADYFTLREHWGNVAGKRLTYIGDGNNICHSLMIMGAKLGVHVSVASPKGYEPSADVIAAMQADMKHMNSTYTFTNDPAEAVAKADAIYTDVWASMGQEGEADDRKPIFMPYQVNAALAAKAPSGALIMHDLPAHRGEEITDEMMDGPTSIVFDQAENRLHAQKGVLAFLHEASN